MKKISFIQPITTMRGRSGSEKNILEDIFSLVLSQFKYQPLET